MRFDAGNFDKYRFKEKDFFPTPRIATVLLMEKETFKGEIFECASGKGHMLKAIKEFHPNTKGNTLENGYDFLEDNAIYDNIVTNPPFNLAPKFILKSKSNARYKIAMLLRLAYLEGVSRYEFFKDKEFPLSKVYVFSRRITFSKGAIKEKGGMIPYAWFIWDKNHEGDATLDWLIYNYPTSRRDSYGKSNPSD